MTDYRPVPDDRVPAFREITQYAFAPETGPPDADPDEDVPEMWTVGERRALFEGSDLVTVCRHIRFGLRVRGAYRDAVGLSSVATPPEHRRRGHVRDLLAASLAEHRDWGATVAALWPFDHPFYRQFGWAVAGRRVGHEVAVGDLAFASDAADGGRFRRVTAEEHADLAPVYRDHAARYALSMDRTPEWWRKRVFRGRETDPHVYAFERDGDVRGYLVYDVGDDERVLSVRELAYRDRTALVALLGFCHAHDSQVDRVEVTGPPEPSLVDVVADPGAVETTVRAGPMARLVDVRDLASVARSGAADGEVVLSVSDPLADWNDGRFRVAADGDGVAVDRTDAAADAETDVATLTQVAVGYRSVDDARAAGDLRSGPADADLLAGLFPSAAAPSYLRDYF